MVDNDKLARLRRLITESLRVQRGSDSMKYIDAGHAMQDAGAKQNHTIFARRGCGKTLLLQNSREDLPSDIKAIYLNCEDFKRHTFPNVLVEILIALFREMESNLPGWFGRKAKSRSLVQQILAKLKEMHRDPDIEEQQIKQVAYSEQAANANIGLKGKAEGVSLEFGGGAAAKATDQTERNFRLYREKLRELDHWLPELKGRIREFFELSNNVKAIFLQIDDLYHLRRADQAFVVDYIHRLCKDVPIFFKIATIRHASTLYADRDGQPIGAQERHDYQSINIDYTFSDFERTRRQNWEILLEYARQAVMTKQELESLFMGEGFSRLVMAGGGVPRDVLSLFLEAVKTHGSDRIGKDEVRNLSRLNLERRIEELKQDSQGDEQDSLLKGIYILREFCLERKTNIFLVPEQLLQQNDGWRSLFNRLLDYRIIHNAGTALTHKSQGGNFQAFAIDIGCYAQFRKMEGRFSEIDVSENNALDKMRSAPVLDKSRLDQLSKKVPVNVEQVLKLESHEED